MDLKLIIGWILLLGFSGLNLYNAWKLLEPKKRTDLIWLPAAASIIALMLMIFSPFLGLISFALLQTLAFYVIYQMVLR
jgi:uncharacterized membrane protein